MITRRHWIRSAAAIAAGAIMTDRAPGQKIRPVAPVPAPAGGKEGSAPLFRISLAQWSLHRAFAAKQIDPLDFPAAARDEYGLDAVEYVSTFYKEHVRDRDYWLDLRNRATRHRVKSLLIMVDGEGAIGEPDEAKRRESVENHYKWVDAAKWMGCHSIRVNAESRGTEEEQRTHVVAGLRHLAGFAGERGINVLVENHGGLSSNGAWLASVMTAARFPQIGTLPDFGNFCFDWSRAADPAAWYDRYQGVKEMMPWAKAVSAKSHDFDERGEETKTDFRRMLRIVLDAGYRGWIGIEYEGERLAEPEGIRRTRALLETVREELARDPAYAAPS